MSSSTSDNRMKYRLRKLLFFVFILIPLWSFLGWYFQGGETFKVALLNKTTQNFNDAEHRAFTWVLNHHHWLKDDGAYYETRKDYLGPLPLSGETSVNTALHELSAEEIEELADYLDAAYFIDTYGTYYEEMESRLDSPPEGGSSMVDWNDR